MKQIKLTLIITLLLPLHAFSDELPFSTLKIEKRNLPSHHYFDATIEAADKATVSAETSGRVADVLFDIGDYVKQGSVIVRLTSEKQRAQLSAAEAKVSEAQANVDIATKEFERIKEVYTKKLVAKSVYDKVEADLSAAKQRLAATQAQLKETKEQLSYTVIRAPFSGVVSERHIEPGEVANSGTPLMTGISLQNLRAVTTIPQTLAATLRDSNSATIKLSESQQTISTDKLVIYPEADPVTHTYKARAYLPSNNSSDKLYPGMAVKIQIQATPQSRLVVPIQSVVYRGELQGVYVVKDNSVFLRQVRTGNTIDTTQIEILAGLTDGEVIALDPVRAGVYIKENNQP